MNALHYFLQLIYFISFSELLNLNDNLEDMFEFNEGAANGDGDSSRPPLGINGTPIKGIYLILIARTKMNSYKSCLTLETRLTIV